MKIFTIEKFTTKDDWLKNRGIGGTSASSIMGANPYRTKTELYDAIVYPDLIKQKKFSNKSTEFGTALEPLIRAEFIEDYKSIIKVKKPPKNNWLFRRIDKPYLTASLDSELKLEQEFLGLKKNSKGILEIKTRELKGYKELEKWMSGELPQHYYIQCLHYLLVTKYDFAILRARLKLTNYTTKLVEEIVIKDFVIKRSEVIKELELLERKETEFYEENIVKKVRPKTIITLPKQEDN